MSSSSLKLIAIVAMAIDHIGYIFFPEVLWLRIIGRLTMPIMAFFAAEGFKHTKNIYKYMLRLFIFAIISEIPYTFLFFPDSGTFFHCYNVIFTILIGIIALWLGECVKRAFNRQFLVFIVYFLCACIAYLLQTDWNWTGVAMIIAFHLANRDKSRGKHTHKQKTCFHIIIVYIFFILLNYAEVFFTAKYGSEAFMSTMLSCTATNLIQLFGLLSLPLLFQYNSQKGFDIKYFFYVFYPLHLFILYTVHLVC